MKRLNFTPGGRGLSNNDILILQEQLYRAVEEQYAGLGAFVISGCAVSANTIAAGLVYVDGRILTFAGASGVSFPAYMRQAAPVEIDVFPLETGGTAAKRIQYAAEVIGNVPSSGESITFTATGGRSYWDAVAGEVVRMRGNQTVNGAKTFGARIIASQDIQHSFKDGIANRTISLKSIYDLIANPHWTTIFPTSIHIASDTNYPPQYHASVADEVKFKGRITLGLRGTALSLVHIADGNLPVERMTFNIDGVTINVPGRSAIGNEVTVMSTEVTSILLDSVRWYK